MAITNHRKVPIWVSLGGRLHSDCSLQSVVERLREIRCLNAGWQTARLADNGTSKSPGQFISKAERCKSQVMWSQAAESVRVCTTESGKREGETMSTWKWHLIGYAMHTMPFSGS